jgi:predicted nucleotide-binding protein
MNIIDNAKISKVFGKLILKFRDDGDVTPDHYMMTNSTFHDPHSGNVPIVHGRNNGAKETVARFVEHLSLCPIVLNEQPNKGLTLIEKLERFSLISAYCIVLLTPDDVGNEVSLPGNSTPRARQNVIFEWGYFISRLGRQHVCTLRWEGVENPSDTSGLVYIKFDEEGAWRLYLAMELKSAGLPVNLNEVMRLSNI